MTGANTSRSGTETTDAPGFVSFAISPWHALGADAWIYRLRTVMGDRRRGIILALPHHSGKNILEPADFPFSSRDARTEIRVVCPPQEATSNAVAVQLQGVDMAIEQLREDLGTWRERLRSDQRHLYVVSPREPWLRPLRILDMLVGVGLRRVKLILTDEGVGTYASESLIRRAMVREGGQLSRVPMRTVKRFVASMFPVERRFLFRLSDGVLSLNEAVAADYRQLLNGGERRLRLGKTTWLLTTPFAEEGEMSMESNYRLVSELVDDLVDQGRFVAVKPHPAEALHKYRALESKASVRVVGARLPIERLLSHATKGDDVFGFPSTGLLTASAIFGLRAYCLSVESLGVSTYLNEADQSFRRLAGALVSSASDVGIVARFST